MWIVVVLLAEFLFLFSLFLRFQYLFFMRLMNQIQKVEQVERIPEMPNDGKKMITGEVTELFTEYGDVNRYKIQEVVGKGSYGVVSSAINTQTGEKVAIKKIGEVFENSSNAVRTLREIKLLRLLKHPDVVEIKHIMLPPSRREFKDIYVVFELMESDLDQVIKANNDFTREHHQFFLYQLLRALKYIHTANVYHRDLKPKNILANANCKLKICDFGLARAAFNNTPCTMFWTDYVATRWYRAPELCGLFFSKYTPAIDIWSIGCIFAEILTGKPLFPGENTFDQLDLMTDLLGTPSLDSIYQVRDEKAKRYLTSMKKKAPISFAKKFPNGDPLALKLLERLLAFDPNKRPTAKEALADPYFKGLARKEKEPSCLPVTKFEFEFEHRKVTKEELRELIFREILEYHPQLLKDYRSGIEKSIFLHPSIVDDFKKKFAHLEVNDDQSDSILPLDRKQVSLPRRSTIVHSYKTPLEVQKNLPGSKPGGIAEVYDPQKMVKDKHQAKNQQQKQQQLLHYSHQPFHTEQTLVYHAESSGDNSVPNLNDECKYTSIKRPSREHDSRYINVNQNTHHSRNN